MDRLQRIYRLHQILASHRRPVARQVLEERLECSKSTVKRIIEELRLYFNAPLKYDREQNGYYYDASEGENFELPGVWFNADELYALLTTQQLLQQIQPGLLENHLKPVRQRFEKILAAQHLNYDSIAKSVRILRMTGRAVNLTHFQTVVSALLQEKQLEISYHSRSNNQKTERKISPQRLTHYRDNWYLDAYCYKRNALRSFAVDRVSGAKILGSAGTKIPDMELDEHFSTSYGIFAGKSRHKAVLRFSAERARWVAEEQWHPQQQGKFLPDGSYELRVPYSNASELEMDILKYGAGVEVIAPQTLRQSVMKRLQEAVKKYQ